MFLWKIAAEPFRICSAPFSGRIPGDQESDQKFKQKMDQKIKHDFCKGPGPGSELGQSLGPPPGQPLGEGWASSDFCSDFCSDFWLDFWSNFCGPGPPAHRLGQSWASPGPSPALGSSPGRVLCAPLGVCVCVPALRQPLASPGLAIWPSLDQPLGSLGQAWAHPGSVSLNAPSFLPPAALSTLGLDRQLRVHGGRLQVLVAFHISQDCGELFFPDWLLQLALRVLRRFKYPFCFVWNLLCT